MFVIFSFKSYNFFCGFLCVPNLPWKDSIYSILSGVVVGNAEKRRHPTPFQGRRMLGLVLLHHIAPKIGAFIDIPWNSLPDKIPSYIDRRRSHLRFNRRFPQSFSTLHRWIYFTLTSLQKHKKEKKTLMQHWVKSCKSVYLSLSRLKRALCHQARFFNENPGERKKL